MFSGTHEQIFMYCYTKYDHSITIRISFVNYLGAGCLPVKRLLLVFAGVDIWALGVAGIGVDSLSTSALGVEGMGIDCLPVVTNEIGVTGDGKSAFGLVPR